MANVGTAVVAVVPSMDGFASSINKSVSGINLGKSGKKVGKSLTEGIGSTLKSGSSALAGIFGGVAATLTSEVMGAISGLTGEMVEASDSAQKFASTLSFAGIDSSTIDALTKSTQRYADETVYELSDIRNVTAQLAANGVDNYAQLAEAAGNLNAVAGGNADTFRSVSMVMSQTAGQGKLVTENWNQLTDAIPGASGALQDAMREAGAFEGNFRDAMANGEVSAEEFFAAVQKLGMQDVAVQAATSTSTIEGALGNLQASVVGLGSQVITALNPLITGAMGQLTTFISGIPAALEPLGQAIVTAMTGGGTADLGATVYAMVTNLMTTLNTALAQAVTQLPVMLQTLLPAVTVALTSLFNAIGAQLPTMVTMLGTGLTSMMTTIGEQLPTAIQTLLPSIISAATNLITSAIAQIPSLLMSFVETVVSGVSSFLSTVGAELPSALPPLVEAALSALNDLVTQIVTDLPTYVDQMVDAALQFLQGIVDAIPEVVPLVVDGIGDLVDTIIENLPEFVGSLMDAAVELFTGIVDAIPEIVPEVLDGIGDLLQRIWDSITSFDLAGAGEQLIQGFIDGIASMAGSVIDAVGSVVSDAIDWAKGLLGIASPSKVFAEIGEYTMEGMARGIEGAAPEAVAAASAAARSVASAAYDGLSTRLLPAFADGGLVEGLEASSKAVGDWGQSIVDAEGKAEEAERDAARADLGEWLTSIAEGADELARRRRNVESLSKLFSRAGVSFSQAFVEEVHDGSSEYADHVADMAAMTDEQLQAIVDLFDQSQVAEKVLELTDALAADDGLSRAFSDLGLDVEDVARDLAELGIDVDDLTGRFEDFADTVTDGFNRMSMMSTGTLHDFTYGLQMNIKQANLWARSVESVFDKVSDYGPAEAFRQDVLEGGFDEYAQMMYELSGKTREEIIEVIDLWNEAAAVAQRASATVMGSLSPSAQSLAGATSDKVISQTFNFNTPVQSPYQTASAVRRTMTYGLAGAR